MSAAFNNVSRETKQRLDHFILLLKKWNSKINLVSRSTIDSAWDRHILDSKQIYDLAPVCSSWMDLGSGGGFPALVVACLAADDRPDLQITLIESDQRKSAFLRTVGRELDLNTIVLTERIENVPPQNTPVLSARALAELPELLKFAARHLRHGGVALFPKGQTWKSEIQTAQRGWSFSYEPIKSQTAPGSVILKIKAPRYVLHSDLKTTANHRHYESKRRRRENDDDD